jgi:choline dehydrogenase-like flavoprotein
VESLKEQQGGDLVSLRLVDVSGARSEVDCCRVFVAAGAIATGAIILSSGLADGITVRDSQTAFGAMVSARRSRKVQPAHTLSHLWARARGGTEFLAQIYPPDRSHAARVAGKLPGVPPRVVDGLIGRLYPFIAYLDSDHSGTLVLSRSGGTVIVTPGREGDRRMMSQHLRRLAKQAARAGFLLPYFASDLAPQGGGFHFGASLPHGTGTDAWGRPFGLQRVHVVDASVLPHIEAGSITPTVMANAHRIARTASLEVK